MAFTHSPPPPRRCDHQPIQLSPKSRRRHRRRAKKQQPNQDKTNTTVCAHKPPNKRSPSTSNSTIEDPYTHQDKWTTAPLPRLSQLDQHSDGAKGTKKQKGQEQLRQISTTSICDDIKLKPTSKTRPKSSKCQDQNFQPTKHTNHNIDENGLYHLLEIAVQNHIENQLSRRHTGHKPYRRFSRRPSNTEIHILNRHKCHSFCMILNYVQQYIDLALDTKNDHSAPKMTNRLRYNTPGGAESREDSDKFSPPALTSCQHPIVLWY
jgi:hypothetical protein